MNVVSQMIGVISAIRSDQIQEQKKFGSALIGQTLEYFDTESAPAEVKAVFFSERFY